MEEELSAGIIYESAVHNTNEALQIGKGLDRAVEG